jgi:hypothetical protein
MIFGFNTDVQGADGLYHVQTEDRGARNPVVESIVYVGGKILGKKRTAYDPASWSKEQIEEAVRLQHKDMTESVRNGSWVPPAQAANAHGLGGHHSDGPAPAELQVSLENPGGFHQGEYFRFHLKLKSSAGNGGAANIPLEVRWLVDGKLSDEQKLASREDGSAEIWVPAPELTQSAQLVVRAGENSAPVFAKFSINPGA